jgi:Trypsin-co-occurring domain 1
MTRLLEVEVEQGGSILVEVEEPVTGPVTRGGQAEAVVKAGETLEHVLGQLGPALKGIVSQLRAAADWPDQVQVEFGVKLSTDANVIVVRTGGEANFKTSMVWSRDRV